MNEQNSKEDYLDVASSTYFCEEKTCKCICGPLIFTHSSPSRGKTYLIISLGNFWNTFALAGQVPQDAVSPPPSGEQQA